MRIPLRLKACGLARPAYFRDIARDAASGRDGKSFENVLPDYSRMLVSGRLAVAQICNDAMPAIFLNTYGLNPCDPLLWQVASRPCSSKDSVIAARDTAQNSKLLQEPLADTEPAEISGVDYRIALSPAANAGFDDNLGRIWFQRNLLAATVGDKQEGVEECQSPSRVIDGQVGASLPPAILIGQRQPGAPTCSIRLRSEPIVRKDACRMDYVFVIFWIGASRG